MADGRSVVVTGGASGIGKAIVRGFAAAGASIVVADIDSAGAEAVAAEAGERARWIGCDVADEGQVDAAVRLAVSEFGSLDVMVNNAGICVLGPLAALSTADFDRMIAVNLKGTFHGIKAAAAQMNGGGVIISTASTAGLNGAPLLGGYGATKARQHDQDGGRRTSAGGHSRQLRVSGLHRDAVLRRLDRRIRSRDRSAGP